MIHAPRNTMLGFSIITFLVAIQCLSATPLAPSGSHGTGMATIEDVSVKCGRSGMNVQIVFDRPFHGVIYSKGHFYQQECNYGTYASDGNTQFTFLIPVDKCGTSGSLDDPTPHRDMYYENTIIIQNDPLIQEVWDVAKSLKCSWQHSFSKSVKSSPFSVKDPDRVNVSFDSRSVNTLIQIQKGTAPFANPATGYIYVGDETSLVIYLTDSINGQLDANPVSCFASSSRGDRVQLVDQNGCVVRTKLMNPFVKIRNPEGIDADLMIYSYFKAFRVGDDPNFSITCQLEVCEGTCLPPCALGPYSGGRKNRFRRELDSQKQKLVTIQKNVTVIARNETAGLDKADILSLNLFLTTLNEFIFLVYVFLIFVCFICFYMLFVTVKALGRWPQSNGSAAFPFSNVKNLK